MYLFILMYCVKFHPRWNRKARGKGSAGREIRSKTTEQLKQSKCHVTLVPSLLK